MVVAATVRNVARFIAPVLYAAGFVPVMIGTIAALSFVERSIGFDDYSSGLSLADLTTFRYNGDIAGAVATLSIGGSVFGLLSLDLLRLEQLRQVTALDHLRHCAFFYATLVLLGFWLMTAYENQTTHSISLGYGVAAGSFLTAGYAILVNALILFSRRRRSNHVNLGGAI